MLLNLCTWPEVEEYLKVSRGIIMPCGSTEQHGPTGLIGTDAICAEIIARGAGDAADALVAPTFNVGMAHYHMGFAGSMTLKPSTMILVLKEWITSLRQHGFERFFFVNAHGGNIGALNSTFQELNAEHSVATPGNQSSARYKTVNWWAAPEVVKLRKKFYGANEGAHATPSEIAITHFAYPEAIKSAELTPKIAPSGRFQTAADYRRVHPDGRIGSDPSLARIEDGKRLYDAAVSDIAAAYREFLTAE